MATTAPCVHCTVGFSCSQKSPVAATGESLLLTGNNRGTASERARWDKYMFNNMTVVRLNDMSHLACSTGKKTLQCTHCALVTLVSLGALCVKEPNVVEFTKILFFTL